MNTRTITLTFTGPCALKLEVPSTTTFEVAGEEVHSTPTMPEVDAQVKVYSAARRLADAREDYAVLKEIRDAFKASWHRALIEAQLQARAYNGDEFLGLLVTSGETADAANAIFAGINASLGARGQA